MPHPARVCIAERIALLMLTVALMTSWSLAQNKIVFVTSSPVPSPRNWPFPGGTAGGDILCNTAANAVPLDTTNGTYRAWLATSAAKDPESTFTQASVPYVLTNGTQVTDDWADLTDAFLDNQIVINENGVTVESVGVWTGTSELGGLNVEPDCLDWTSSDALQFGAIGVSDNTTVGQWSVFTNVNCNQHSINHLYCFQQGPVPVELLQFTVE